MRSIAVPSRRPGHSKAAVAAIAISAPASRLEAEVLSQARAALINCAERIEREMFTESRVFPQKGRVIVDILKQTRTVFTNIRDVLTEVGAGLEHVVDVHAYLTDMSEYEGFNEAYSELFGFDGPPRTTVGVKELPHPHQHLMVRAACVAVTALTTPPGTTRWQAAAL